MTYDNFYVYCKESSCLCSIKCTELTIIDHYDSPHDLPLDDIDELFMCETVERANDFMSSTKNYIVNADLNQASYHINEAEALVINSWFEEITFDFIEVNVLKISSIRLFHCPTTITYLHILDYQSESISVCGCKGLIVGKGSLEEIELVDIKFNVTLEVNWDNITSIIVQSDHEFSLTLKNYMLYNHDLNWGNNCMDNNMINGNDVIISKENYFIIQMSNMFV